MPEPPPSPPRPRRLPEPPYLRPLPWPPFVVLVLVVSALLTAASPRPATGQAGAAADAGLTVAWSDGRATELTVERQRGYPALPGAELRALGWAGSEADGEYRLRHRTGIELRFRPGSPFLRWDDQPVQMVHAAYRFGDDMYLPLQLVVDLFPGFLPRAYAWDPEARVLRVEGPATEAAAGDQAGLDEANAPAPLPPRLIVIDPGHGGHDTGAVGPGGTREKDVALAVALALARELSADPGYEVRLTRTVDEFVPLWERGARATEWKGDRPGLFLSLHANAVHDRPGVRGFETYFLAEARTEHERRVAAAENASLGLSGEGDQAPSSRDPLLADILRDLRTFDHQHWSALLAEIVQENLGGFHPGPDRGVRQGPFAVITNALMPSVLIEVGFISNRDEERLLGDPAFHRDTARAIARSVERFFERYPPGSESR